MDERLVSARPCVDTSRRTTGSEPHGGSPRAWAAPHGVTFNFENTETDYKSGDEFHFEWAVGLEFAPGLLIGVVGYDYRQITDNSGSGARIGPFRGRVDAVGPGLTYTTLFGRTPFILNVRHYTEFNAHNRWEGNSTIVSGTLRF